MRADRPEMPGYGLATADAGAGLLPWSWAEGRLTEARNYFLATTRPDGRPHVAPVWAVWLDGALWFSTGERSRKARNLAADPRCSVTPEGADEAVLVEGTAERVDDVDARARFFEIYRAKYPVPVPEEEPVFAVRPATVIGFSELGLQDDATRWREAPSP